MTDQQATAAFVISAKYVLDPTDTAAFKDLAARMAQAARRRSGCSFLNAAQDVLDPNIFHLTEGWTGQSELAEHFNSDEFQTILKEALGLRIRERSGTIYLVSGTQPLEMPS
ncbi:MAG TPA: antibiotic biosynthesis monooxygenase [Sphingomonas sp.]|nr:antibiotic biosynthesis monooxygenase [Sphingomonas sp.]